MEEGSARTTSQRRFLRAISVVIGATALLGATAILRPMSAEGDDSTRIEVHFRSVRSNDGMVRCALFATPKGFPSEYRKAIKGKSVRATRGETVCRFDGLSAGAYAVAGIHDENNNGELDANFVGMPEEGWGVSNNAGPRTFGPPTFEDAKFEFTGGTTRLQIRMRY